MTPVEFFYLQARVDEGTAYPTQRKFVRVLQGADLGVDRLNELISLINTQLVALTNLPLACAADEIQIRDRMHAE
eukprot:m51a1_g6337 hypothetical protein (75) ;mRNA; f:26725-26949